MSPATLTTAANDKTAAVKGTTAATNGKTAATNGKTAATNGKTAATNGKTAAVNGTTAEPEFYGLQRDLSASIRLNFQHFMWKKAIGYLLHPTIIEGLKTDKGENAEIKIADVATGTGIWLLDCLQAPELQGFKLDLHGFDVSAAQFTHPGWLPPNVRLSTADAFEEPPVEFRGRFDVVHMRLLVCAVADGDPSKLIRFAKMLLRPGGYIQWDEIDLVHHYDVVRAPGSDERAGQTMEACKAEVTNRSAVHAWTACLPTHLAKHGFVDTKCDVYYHDPMWCQIFILSGLGCMKEFAEGEPDAKIKEELMQLYMSASADLAGGVVIKQGCPVNIGKLAS